MKVYEKRLLLSLEMNLFQKRRKKLFLHQSQFFGRLIYRNLKALPELELRQLAAENDL
jgi:hypothetical protein